MKAYVFGKDLAACVDNAGANTPLINASKREWVKVSLDEDAYALGAEFNYPIPFFCCDQWHTIKDYVPEHWDWNKNQIVFAGMKMTLSALESAIFWIEKEEKIKAIEAQAQVAYKNQDYLEVLRIVCKWGGITGNRVLGNIMRNSRESLDPLADNFSRELKLWFDYTDEIVNKNSIRSNQSPLSDKGVVNYFYNVILKGSELKGLGVSYASKHLRLLFPNHFPVLDSLICEEFGFALNPSGYLLFIDYLQKFKQQHPALDRYNIGEIESGLFMLIRNGAPPDLYGADDFV